MKILLLSETLTAGGAETFAIRLANALASRHQVTLAIMHGQRVEPQLAAQIDARVGVERLELPAERWLWRVDGALRRFRIDSSILRWLQRRWLRRIVAREQPDVIHSHLFKADRLAAQVRHQVLSPPRHVITMHGDYAPYLKRQADPLMLHGSSWMERVLGSADAIVAICHEHLEHVSTDFPAIRPRLHLVYNGYSASGTPKPVPLPRDKFLFGMVSRGVEQKGWGLAVEAFRALGRDDAALVLVGDGPAIARLQREKPPGVIFAGFSPTPLDWIDRFDVGLLPTLFPHESLPTAIIEYLACAKPVIATDVGEIGAMLTAPEGHRAGRLLPFQDRTVRVEQLSQAMAELMSDARLRADMRDAAEAAFKQFDMGRCVEAYEALYRGEVPSRSSISANH